LNLLLNYQMKKLLILIVILLFIIINPAFTQDDIKKINFEIDSLAKLKSNLEKQAISINAELKNLENQLRSRRVILNKLILDDNNSNGSIYSFPSEAELLKSPYALSSTILKIPANEKLFLFYFFVQNYVLVNYQGSFGYINLAGAIPQNLKDYFEISATRTARDQVLFLERLNFRPPDTVYAYTNTALKKLQNKDSQTILNIDNDTPICLYYKNTSYSLVKVDTSFGFIYYENRLLSKKDFAENAQLNSAFHQRQREENIENQKRLENENI
jgi:hypothetical protein